jgi:hypothetical protein
VTVTRAVTAAVTNGAQNVTSLEAIFDRAVVRAG